MFTSYAAGGIEKNKVGLTLLGKVGVKISFEFDKIVMTKNNVFVGKGYYDQGLFVLNVSKVINENASSSTYLIDSYDIWHARLGHVNPTYVMKLQRLGLINMHDKQSKKYEICVESKIN